MPSAPLGGRRSVSAESPDKLNRARARAQGSAGPDARRAVAPSPGRRRGSPRTDRRNLPTWQAHVGPRVAALKAHPRARRQRAAHARLAARDVAGDLAQQRGPSTSTTSIRSRTISSATRPPSSTPKARQLAPRHQHLHHRAKAMVGRDDQQPQRAQPNHLASCARVRSRAARLLYSLSMPDSIPSAREPAPTPPWSRAARASASRHPNCQAPWKKVQVELARTSGDTGAARVHDA